MDPIGAGPSTADASERHARSWHHPVAVCLAVLGGVLGIGGAFIEEVRAGGGIAVFFFGAPIIEEALKPSGIYIGLIRWPHILRGQLYTALLTALAGLTFGVIESAVYVTVYVSDPPDWYVTYRFTVTLALHVVASFIVGLGLNRGVIEWARGRAPLPKASRNFYLTAVALHAAYNATALVLGLAGVFPDN